MRPVFLVILSLLLTTTGSGLAAAGQVKQILLVRQDAALPDRGTITLYELVQTGWKPTLGPLPALLGKRGTAWGRGPWFAPPRQAPVKREGDGRTPAGLFSLGILYGYAPNPPVATKLPYTRITRYHYAVNDPRSRHYNKTVDIRKVRRDWQSAGPMARSDRLYPWLLEIAHNQDNPLKGAGTWIYLHPWLSKTTPTEGCTAVSPPDFTRIIQRLDPARHPRIAVIPADKNGEILFALLGLNGRPAASEASGEITAATINTSLETVALHVLETILPPTSCPVLYPPTARQTPGVKGRSG